MKFESIAVRDMQLPKFNHEKYAEKFNALADEYRKGTVESYVLWKSKLDQFHINLILFKEAEDHAKQGTPIYKHWFQDITREERHYLNVNGNHTRNKQAAESADKEKENGPT